MEIPQYIQTRATIVNACYSDLVSSEGKFYSNNIFFLKHETSRNFYSTYTLPDNDWNNRSEIDVLADKEEIDLLRFLLAKRLIYKLTPNNNSTDFEFNLVIKKANLYDLFYCPKFIKENRIYYVLSPLDGTITGPLFVSFDTNPEIIKEAINKGNLFVPTKKQLFEPYRVKSA